MSGLRTAWLGISALAVGIWMAPLVTAAGPTFRADFHFTGSSLTGFTPMGQAQWRAENGEIIGTPTAPTGGWLFVDDKAFQDLQMYANVQCLDRCKAGFLVRAAKTPDGGMAGILMSLTEGDLQPYLVRINPQGREVGRDLVEPEPPPAGGGRGGGRGRGGRAARPEMPADIAAELPEYLVSRSSPGQYVPGGYNDAELLITENSIRPRFNMGALGGGGSVPVPAAAEDSYGQIALYVGGTGEARFKDFSYKDILLRTWAPVETGSNWQEIRIDPHYYSWSSAAADFNHDGVMDLAAGPYWYAGPDFSEGRQIYVPEAFNPTAQYPIPAMVNIAYDFTGDGWDDVLSMSGNAGNGTGNLYVNPQNQSRLWPHYVTIQPVGNEETVFKDITGDGRPDLIHAGDNTLRYSTVDPSRWDPANPTAMWTTHTISEPGPWGWNIGHGLGVADINGDGRNDFLNAYGWWEQPPAGSTGLWTHHPTAFGRWGNTQGGAGGAEICGYDINGDGLMDAVGPQEGHGFGIAWWEQVREGGEITFVEHEVMDDFLSDNAGDVVFTEPHASTCADVDGDGLQDLITGKRYMSHFGYSDPDPFSEPVLYVYRAVRNSQAPGGAEFVPELVSNRVGVGSHFVVTDMNGDGMADIAISANVGTYVFLNQRPRP